MFYSASLSINIDSNTVGAATAGKPTLPSQSEALSQIPATLSRFQPPANVPGKAATDGPSVWAPDPHMGDWAQLLVQALAWSRPAVVNIWIVNRQMKGLCVALSFK